MLAVGCELTRAEFELLLGRNQRHFPRGSRGAQPRSLHVSIWGVCAERLLTGSMKSMTHTLIPSAWCWMCSVKQGWMSLSSLSEDLHRASSPLWTQGDTQGQHGPSHTRHAEVAARWHGEGQLPGWVWLCSCCAGSAQLWLWVWPGTRSGSARGQLRQGPCSEQPGWN